MVNFVIRAFMLFIKFIIDAFFMEAIAIGCKATCSWRNLRNLREARDVCRPLEETEDSQGGMWRGWHHEGRIVSKKVVFQSLRD